MTLYNHRVLPIHNIQSPRKTDGDIIHQIEDKVRFAIYSTMQADSEYIYCPSGHDLIYLSSGEEGIEIEVEVLSRNLPKRFTKTLRIVKKDIEKVGLDRLNDPFGFDEELT